MGPSSFSFNSGDGRCDHCQGLGYERVEMQFLSDVFVPCPVCEGRRFKAEVLAVEWNGASVADVLEMSVTEALRALRGLRADPPAGSRRSSSVGLGYLALGQPLNTLSGGESQRLKLVRYLGSLPGEAGALLLLDEPTTGLHRHDIGRLLERPAGPRRPGPQPRRDRAQPRRAQGRRLDHRGRAGGRGGGRAGSSPRGRPRRSRARASPRPPSCGRPSRAGRGPPCQGPAAAAGRGAAAGRRRLDRGCRRPREQPEEPVRLHSPAPAHRRHRRLGLRKVDPGVRHHLRRGPAPVHGVDVALRPAVRRADAAAGARPADRHPARGRDRAARDARLAQVHRRHDHRGGPVPAPPLRAHRRPAPSRHRPARHAALAPAR